MTITTRPLTDTDFAAEVHGVTLDDVDVGGADAGDRKVGALGDGEAGWHTDQT
jgi:hypothetical protein